MPEEINPLVPKEVAPPTSSTPDLNSDNTNKVVGLLEKANQSEAELRLVKKEAELKVLETQIDKKVQILQKLVDDNLQNGRAVVQVQKDKETLERERLNKILASTGLKI